MIETSSTYKQKVLQDGREWRVNAIVTTRNGSTLSITNPNIMENGLSISDGTSEKGKFCVGSFVSKQLTLKIANFDGIFKEDKFDGATIYLKIGLVIGKNESTGEESIEWIKLGVFYISDHHSAGGIITIIAYDAASKFERKYDSKITYPTTLYNILLDACNNCGVPLYNTSIKVDTLVWKAPSEEAITYANVVSYIAQIEASWARINNNGELVLGWYDMDQFYPESGDILDGNGEPTISGSSAITFDAYQNSLIKSLAIHGKGSQDGSGTPSPSNVRPIHGVKYIEKWAGLSPDNRNLLINSDFSKVTATSTISISNGVATMTGAIGVSNRILLVLSDYALQNMRNKNVTASYFAMGTNITAGNTNPFLGVELHIQYADNSNDYDDIIIESRGTFQLEKLEKTFQVKDKDVYGAWLSLCIRDFSGTIQYKLPKLEIGVASTEWTLAPEDLSSYQKITFSQELFDLSPNNRNLLVDSDFSKVTATSTISISNGVATMTGAIGVQNKIQLTLSNYALQNMCGKEIVGSMYGAGTNIAYGTTNPWIGAELVINYDDGSGDYFNVWGDKLFPSGTSAWSKNEKAYQVKDKEISEAHVVFLIRDASGSVQFKLPKWELGTASTEWTLAPEDSPSYQNGTADSYDAVSETGTLKNKKAVFDGSSDEAVSYYSSYGSTNYTRFQINIGSLGGLDKISWCDRLAIIQNASWREESIHIENDATYVNIVIGKSYIPGWLDSWTDSQKVSAFKTWLSSNPVSIVYQLPSPQTISGSSQQITVFESTTVTIDNGGQADITYSTADIVDGGSFYPIAPSVDGGTLLNYSQTDLIDAGNFTDYSETDELNGGDFFEYGNHIEDFISGGVFRKNLPTPLTIKSLNSCNVHTSDVKITGVEISTTEWKNQDYMVGSNGYVVSIKQNPYAIEQIDLLALWIATELIDFSFRPMEISALDDPSIEAGDVVYVVDDHGNTYPTIVSNIEYSIGDYEKFSADAESESKKQSVNYDVETKAVQSAKEIAISGISTYEVQTFNFVNMAAYAMGLYATKQQAADGSYILYWHDKQVLSSSSNVWKLDENSFTVSIDGGTTWKSIDNSTNIIYYLLNILGVYTSINNKLPINSPQMTGIPTAPTAANGTNTAQLATTAFVTAAISNLALGTENPTIYLTKEDLLTYVYPIGTYYISFKNVSPASFLGGTWMRQEDVFLYGSTQDEMKNGTYYGGSKTKTISQDNLPNVGLYTHGYYTVDNNLDGSTVQVRARDYLTNDPNDWIGALGGGGKAMDIMPPYVGVHMWKRLS